MKGLPVWLRVLACLAALCSLGPVAFCWLMVVGVRAQWGAEHTGAAGLMAWVVSVIAAGAVAIVLVGLMRPAMSWRLVAGALVSCAALSLSPAITRLVLPMEDPNTGQGSPMGGVLSVIVLGVGGGVVFAVPAVAVAGVMVWRATRDLTKSVRVE